MSNLFEHCRAGVSSASQRYEKPEAMQINLLFAEAKYSRCSQSAISLCQSAAGGGCAGRRRRSDAALCMGGCGLPLFGCGRRANLSKLYFSRPPACGIALQKQPNSHFGKHPAPPIGCLLQGADLPPFVTERWCQKCPPGEKLRETHSASLKRAPVAGLQANRPRFLTLVAARFFFRTFRKAETVVRSAQR